MSKTYRREKTSTDGNKKKNTDKKSVKININQLDKYLEKNEYSKQTH